jgi:hypothetical protein
MGVGASRSLLVSGDVVGVSHFLLVSGDVVSKMLTFRWKGDLEEIRVAVRPWEWERLAPYSYIMKSRSLLVLGELVSKMLTFLWKRSASVYGSGSVSLSIGI